MKKLTYALIALALVAGVFSTTATAATLEVEGDAYIGYFDKYLWRGFDLSGSLPVVQGGVDISAAGFTVSYWTNIQTKTDKGEGFIGGEGTETDIVIDYTFSPTDILSISVGDIYYMLEGLEDTHEAYLSVGLDTILAPAVTVYYDWDEADENGLYYTAAIGHGFDITDSISLSLGAAVGYNDESDYAVGNYSDWHNYEVSAGVDIALGEQFSVSPSFLYSSPISEEAKLAIDSEMVGGVTLTFAF